MKRMVLCAAACIFMMLPAALQAQKYDGGLIDKSIAVVGNEMISISQLEEEVQVMRAQGLASDRNVRCELLEQMMESKLFLMQARLDSLSVNNDMVEGELRNRIDMIRTRLGGDEEMEKYFSSYEVKITTVAQSKTGTPFTWDKDTTGPVYFKVNKNETVNFVVKLTKTDGTKVEDKTYSYSLSPGNAKKITLTPNVTSGSFELTIKIDETVIDHIVDIEVPSDWV